MTTPEVLLEAGQRPTARHMIEFLRGHYLPPRRPPAGIFAPEIAAPGGRRRADLIWLGCTARAHELVGHEIKVDRGDLRAELEDATKSDSWQLYCDRWWLVVPDRAVVNGLDLLASWGVMLPPSGRRTRSMTVLTPAPRLVPDEQGPGLRTLAAWMHWRLADTRRELAERGRSLQQLTKRVQRQDQALLEREPEHASPGRQREHTVVEEIVRRLGGADFDNQIGTWDRSVDVDDVVAALRDLGLVRAQAHSASLLAGRMTGELRRLLVGIEAIEIEDLTAAAEHTAGAAGAVQTDLEETA